MNIRKYQFGGFSKYYNLDNKNTRKAINEGTKKFANAGLNVLGMVGDLFSSVLTGTPTTTTNPKTVSPEMALQLKQSILKGMTWLSPLNYGAALSTGHGLNAKKGEEQVAKWDPRLLLIGRLGELYVGPKGVKGIKNAPKTIVNTAAKAGNKTAKKVIVARELSNGIKENTKSGRIEVSPEYFKAEDKWYRLSERPEKIGIEELGKNITTQDDPEIPGTIGNWRSTILDNRKGLNGKSKRIVPKPDNGFVLEEGMNFAKHGQAHGNTSQAAKGLIWDGTFAFSNRFPVGIIEGQAPNKIFRGMTAEGKDSRSNFVLLDWENVPIGSRVGFHTGEMPMSNLGWFLRTNKGTYTYEPIIPEKRITVDVARKYKLLGSLPRLLDSKTYPLYRGPRFSVNSVVNPDGTVNPRQAMTVLHTVADWFGNKAHRMEDRLENSKWHKNDPTTYDHTKQVARSAWQLPTPKGFTKQDLMISALGHDFGKMISGEGHALIGADLARQVFPDLTDAQYNAIAEHMGTPVTSLGLVTKAADITNGRPFSYLQQYAPDLYGQYFGNTIHKVRNNVMYTDDYGLLEMPFELYFENKVNSIPKDLVDKSPISSSELEYKQEAYNTMDFTPKYRMNVGKLNEAWGLEILRRLHNLGYNTGQDGLYIKGQHQVITNPELYVRLNNKNKVTLGYFNHEGGENGGFYGGYWNEAAIDPTNVKSIPSAALHERVMHGTDKMLEGILYNQGGNAQHIYLDFINRIFYDNEGNLKPVFREDSKGNIAFNGYRIYKDDLNWKEVRATIAELARKLYVKVKGDNKITSIQDLEKFRPAFEKEVDTNPSLLESLSKINGYGLTYSKVGPVTNPTFLEELKWLLKYAPAASTPLIFKYNEKE